MNETRENYRWIKSRREAEGLSQRELADQLGISRNRLNQWENGKAVPNIQQRKLLEEIFTSIQEPPVIEKVEEHVQEVPVEVKKTKLNWFALFVFACLICVVAVVIVYPHQQVLSSAAVSESLVQQAESRLIQEEQEFVVVVEKESNMDELSEYLITELSELDGEWSVYVENLNTEEVIEINSHMQKSASLIKLFTAGCYEEELLNGNLSATRTSEYNEKYMISQSNNDSWVNLETFIGHGVIEPVIQL